MIVHVNTELQRNEILGDGGLLIAWFQWNNDRAEYVSDRGEGLGKSWGEAVDAAKRLPEDRRERARQNSKRKR